MTKEFMRGLYPEKAFRDDRIKEIQQQLDILVANREDLQKQINQLLFEAKIVQELNQLESFIKGEINLELQNPPKNE